MCYYISLCMYMSITDEVEDVKTFLRVLTKCEFWNQLSSLRFLAIYIRNQYFSYYVYIANKEMHINSPIIILILQLSVCLSVCDVRAGGHGKRFDPS